LVLIFQIKMMMIVSFQLVEKDSIPLYLLTYLLVDMGRKYKIHHHYFQYGTNPTHMIRNCVVEHMSDLSDYFIVYPLYALSHYSLPELKKMAIQLQLPLSKTRKQIYEDIQKEIQI
jgi:hypothetical protein